MIHTTPDDLPRDTAHANFDSDSGSWLERFIFGRRDWILAVGAALTFLLLASAAHLRPNGSFERMVPTGHPYIANFLAHRADLPSGNSLRIAVAVKADKPGSIYDPAYLDTLRKINDELFLLPGVDRPQMKSIWTPNMRWIGVTEDGLEGGPVIPNGYDGSADSLARLRANIDRSGEVGFSIAADERSSIVGVPLLAQLPDGSEIDYRHFDARIEALREKYESPTIAIHITGFPKLLGDLIAGMGGIVRFFALAIALSAVALYAYTRCLRSTALVIACSLVAVVWQSGLMPLLGFGLDPYAVLVPFLVFAIGMSHGAQKMNGIMQDIGRGATRLVAARYTFRRLFVAGVMALLCDAVGFAVLLSIPITVIRDLALVASLGVAVLVVTNLILLPLLLSYVGVSPRAAARSVRSEQTGQYRLLVLVRFTRRRWAVPTVLVCAALGLAGYVASLRLQVGDLEPGAPELRQSSRYNQDSRYMTGHYGASSDVLVAMVTTPPQACSSYDTLAKVDALDWQLRQTEGVESSISMAMLTRRVMVGLNEGNPLWGDLVRNQAGLNNIMSQAPRGLYNDGCTLLPMYVFLSDHKAQTLERATSVISQFAAANDTAGVKFLLGAGNSGFDAATNEVVARSNHQMLALVYGAVTLLCLLTFRSWRATVCALLPLMLTSILGEALMVWLDIGVKVATLPVIALGVGIGVDYALYIMSILMAQLRRGASLVDAYAKALQFTGRVVLFTGATLAIGVATWAFSPIKFQADMGVLLAFMFVLNMLGSLILLPALAHFLLQPRRALAPMRAAATGNTRVLSRDALGTCRVLQYTEATTATRMTALAERGKSNATQPGPTAAALLWSPVQAETLSWRIVSQVRGALFSGQLKSGDLLGSEATIAQQFQVSRMAARDALRTLEAVGIVEIRMGIKGGAWIAQGNANRFADALSIQLQLIGVTAEEILDTQLAIDPVAAGLAATLASPEDIVRLEAAAAVCQQHRGDPDAFTAASINFHELVIECSRNRVLLAQFRALRSVLQPLVRPNTTDEVMRRLTRSNRALLSALASGDAVEAARLMRDRVTGVRASLLGIKASPTHAAAPPRDKANR